MCGIFVTVAPPSGVPLTAVTVPDSFPAVCDNVKFRVAMANDRMLDDYGPIRALPTTFFINRKGDIVRRVVGYIDGETMEDYVKEILE